jgi:hypothetical protein
MEAGFPESMGLAILNSSFVAQLFNASKMNKNSGVNGSGIFIVQSETMAIFTKLQNQRQGSGVELVLVYKFVAQKSSITPLCPSA